MNSNSRKVFNFIISVITDRTGFFFWLFIRFVSAVFPLVTIYLFSLVVKSLEIGRDFSYILSVILLIFLVRFIDNFLRLKSTFRLEHIISNISFDIHNVFLSNLKAETKDQRHAIVQSIRNFSDASGETLHLIKQPGIDSLVSLIFIPAILFVLDFKIFILSVAYLAVYYFIDLYTTQHYARLKDNMNTKTEAYYAKLQESNDFDLEQKAYTRHHHRLTNWGFTEWSLLQNTAVLFYVLILLYLVFSVTQGTKEISDLVLISGYVSQIQVLLNSFSSIKDSLADMFVGLEHLAKNTAVSAIDLDDLI